MRQAEHSLTLWCHVRPSEASVKFAECLSQMSKPPMYGVISCDSEHWDDGCLSSSNMNSNFKSPLALVLHVQSQFGGEKSKTNIQGALFVGVQCVILGFQGFGGRFGAQVMCRSEAIKCWVVGALCFYLDR